ncbi:MAG: sigma-70 family RNA polymerase sigma factor [Treponema sp.]|nr:sigma-70 family RNA polymerase sigma factor [Treponema sp.]
MAKDVYQVTTFGELKQLLPSTGTGRVPGITKLRETAVVVLHARTESGVLEVFDNGFYTYMENGHATVYAVDRCNVLEWYSCTGEKLTSKDANVSELPWTMPLEIAGYNRLEHNNDSRQDSKADYSLNAPASDNNLLFSVRPAHELQEEAREELEYRAKRVSQVKKALNSLTKRQREILLMFYVDRLTQEAIAERTGLSRLAVRTHLGRAEKKFRDFFRSCSHFTP